MEVGYNTEQTPKESAFPVLDTPKTIGLTELYCFDLKRNPSHSLFPSPSPPSLSHTHTYSLPDVQAYVYCAQASPHL